MAPTKGWSYEQRASKKFERGVAELRAGRFLRVTQAVKKRMVALPDVERCLVPMGAMTAAEVACAAGFQFDSTPTKGETSSGEITPRKDGSLPGSSCKEEADDVGQCDSLKSVVGAWDRTWTRMGTVGPSFLERLLQKAVPAILRRGPWKPCENAATTRASEPLVAVVRVRGAEVRVELPRPHGAQGPRALRGVFLGRVCALWFPWSRFGIVPGRQRAVGRRCVFHVDGQAWEAQGHAQLLEGWAEDCRRAEGDTSCT